MRGYDTAEYAATRLVDTIIMHNNEPVFVHKIGVKDDKISVRCTRLLDEEDKVMEVYLSECDINPVSLGYVNYKKSASYIMRTPKRNDWRQGLRMLNIVDVEGSSPRGIPYRVIAQTIMGKFPTFQSSLERLNSRDKIVSMAFSRDFSITNKGALTYKGLIDVGNVSMENGNVLIHDNCNWVGEALDEALNGNLVSPEGTKEAA